MKNFLCFIFFLKIIFSLSVATAQRSTDYDSLISRGNMAITEKRYVLAKTFFRQALERRPADPSYPLFQIRFADSLLTANAKSNPTGIRDRFNLAMTAFENYGKAATIANYEDELLYLKQFLNLIPDSSELAGGYDPARKIRDAQEKIKSIREYLARTKGSLYQPEAIPYTDLELGQKFPRIRFADIPDQQERETIDQATLNDIIIISKEVLKENPHLALSDSAANVKLTYQSFKVKDNNVYLRFCIRNYSTDDFVTGPMQLNLIKKDKIITRLRPVYISNFPNVVLPNKEFFIVYVTKTTKVNKDEQLTFEVKDLFQNKKLKVNIPAAEFNQVKNL